MKSTFALVAFAAAAFAQIPGLPTCANSCIQLPTECQVTDYKCICSASSFISTISCCVSQKCNGVDQATVIKFAQGLCGSYGVTVPTQATCASGAASTGASSSAAPASSSPAAGAGGNGTSAANSTVTTTATVSTTTTATATAQTGAAGTMMPQAGVLLGGVVAGMVLL